MAKIQLQSFQNQAKLIGKDSFKRGQKCVPVLDSNLMKFIDTNKELINQGDLSKIFKSWLNGWHSENLKG